MTGATEMVGTAVGGGGGSSQHRVFAKACTIGALPFVATTHCMVLVVVENWS
jgi:hypothetical protein